MGNNQNVEEHKVEGEVKLPSVGRIVIYHPGKNEVLPNNMTEAPAIVLQTFGQLIANIAIFVVDTSVLSSKAEMVRTGWSVNHKSQKTEGQSYWTWPEIV